VFFGCFGGAGKLGEDGDGDMQQEGQGEAEDDPGEAAEVVGAKERMRGFEHVGQMSGQKFDGELRIAFRPVFA
jgi:hypothetical protein